MEVNYLTNEYYNLVSLSLAHTLSYAVKGKMWRRNSKRVKVVKASVEKVIKKKGTYLSYRLQHL